MNNQQDNLGEVVLYKTENGKAALDVRLAGETVWLTQAQMAKLFERDQSVIQFEVNPRLCPDLYPESILLDTGFCVAAVAVRSRITSHIAVMSSRRCKPNQRV